MALFQCPGTHTSRTLSIYQSENSSRFFNSRPSFDRQTITVNGFQRQIIRILSDMHQELILLTGSANSTKALAAECDASCSFSLSCSELCCALCFMLLLLAGPTTQINSDNTMVLVVQPLSFCEIIRQSNDFVNTQYELLH